MDPGAAIAHYELGAKIGAGAMGEVFRARDGKLGRTVAIKVLHPSVAAHREALARFDREALTLASLNHPNIATIHGIEPAGDSKAIVMEFVEGDTLDARLATGPLPVAEALDVFYQIACALCAAHDSGVVHRDLKPSNIKITPDGTTKVLDFGIAKVARDDGGAATGEDAETLPVDTTLPGTVLGTPAYMSPEQARGIETDARTDAWAFGCCLFESLAGTKPFRGATATDTIAEILRSNPDLGLLPADTPADVVALVRRCLEKDPRRRLRNLGDIAIRLEEARDQIRAAGGGTSSTAPRAPRHAPSAAQRRNRSWLGTAAAVALATAAGALAGWALKGSGPAGSPPPAPSEIDVLAVLPFNNLSGDAAEDMRGDLIADHIRVALDAIAELEVRRTGRTIRDYEAGGKRYREIAQELRVGALIDGSISKVDGRFEAVASLVAPDETVLWSRSFFAQDFHTVRDEIVAAIADEIEVNLNEAGAGRARDTLPEDYQTYTLFRRGLDRMDKYTPESFRQARVFFEEAISRDRSGTFLPPRISLSYVHWMPLIWGGEKTTDPPRLERARGTLADAAVLFPDNPTLELQTAFFEMFADFKWDRIKGVLDRELERPPDKIDPEVYWLRCWYLLFVEARNHEALRTIELGIQRDPNRLAFQDTIAEVYGFMGRSSEAAAVNREIREDHPDEWDRLTNLGLDLKVAAAVARGAGDETGAAELFAEARSAAAEAVSLSDRNPATLALLAEIIAAEGADGSRQQVDELLAEIEGIRATGRFLGHIWTARVHAELGDHAEAIRLLELGHQNREGWSFLYGLRHPSLVYRLANEPGFWALIDRMDLPWLPVGHRFRANESALRRPAP